MNRRPWFAPYLEAGAAGSTQDAELGYGHCPCVDCDRIHEHVKHGAFTPEELITE